MTTQNPVDNPKNIAPVSQAAPPTPATPEEIEREPNPIKRLFMILGPGLVTGASDDDPSGIGTYVSAGASLGFTTLWMALFIFPFMAAVQFICAKIGMVSGKGVAGVIRENYSKKLLFPVIFFLVVAN